MEICMEFHLVQSVAIKVICSIYGFLHEFKNQFISN